MDVQVLRNFIQLAETLHFTKASEQVLMAQPALSRQIRQLEAEIGAELFRRNKRNVKLSPAGEYFKEAAQQLVNQLDHAMERTRQIHQGEAGEIRIGYTHSIVQTILPRIVERIRAEFPGIKTILREMNNSEQYRDLAEGRLDIGFATNPIVPPGIRHQVFFEDVFVVVVPAGHPALGKPFRDISVFAREPFILPHAVEGSDYVHTVESICLDTGFFPNVVHSTSSVSSALKLVEAGLGITIEPKGSLAGQNLAVKWIELGSIRQKVQSVLLWNAGTETEMGKVLEVLRELK